MLAAAETSFVTGLVVPAGVATSVGAVLATQGVVSPVAVLVAALAGGAAGDSGGYWIGRLWGERALPSAGPVGRRVQQVRHGAEAMFGRHPVVSVGLARLVAFVRTLMPLAAGTARLPYPRFLLYDLPAVAVCMGTYFLLGLVAGRSLELVASMVGLGWTAVFAVAGLVAWWRARRARLLSLEGGAEDAAPAESAPSPARGGPSDVSRCSVAEGG